jgi:hypothetical protein
MAKADGQKFMPGRRGAIAADREFGRRARSMSSSSAAIATHRGAMSSSGFIRRNLQRRDSGRDH